MLKEGSVNSIKHRRMWSRGGKRGRDRKRVLPPPSSSSNEARSGQVKLSSRQLCDKEGDFPSDSGYSRGKTYGLKIHNWASKLSGPSTNGILTENDAVSSHHHADLDYTFAHVTHVRSRRLRIRWRGCPQLAGSRGKKRTVVEHLPHRPAACLGFDGASFQVCRVFPPWLSSLTFINLRPVWRINKL